MPNKHNLDGYQRIAKMETAASVRPAKLADVTAITEIYNEVILTTTATFDIEPKSFADRTQWLQAHGEKYPVLVAVVDGQTVGFAALRPWSQRRAYDQTVESCFYVRSTQRGRGIGRMLKEAIIEEARRLGFHTIIARMAEGSNESLHLNQSLGFVHVGTLREVGRKFGKLIDVQIMQKILD